MDEVVHFEIPADDLPRAKKFYSTVFDWKASDVPEMEYVMLGTTESDENGMPKQPGAINGGMMKRQDSLKHPVVTIDVENIDDALAKVKKNGGQVVREKLALGDMGFTAYIRDSEGNVVGLWQNPNK
ncbi:MAG: VOC family protein [Candidatus Bathyarchaeia archaeon]|jgi:predicted enzyme related to lactoylglutathione lyase